MKHLEDAPPVTQVQLWDIEFYLPNDMLVKVDRASMSVSLEVRVPMLCPKLAELAFRVPEAIRYQPATTKPLLRSLVGRRFGSRISQAPKQGFAIPRKAWMREAASIDLERRIVEGQTVADGVLDPQGIARLFQDVRGNFGRWQADRTEEIFSLIVFDHWWNRHRRDGT